MEEKGPPNSLKKTTFFGEESVATTPIPIGLVCFIIPFESSLLPSVGGGDWHQPCH